MPSTNHYLPPECFVPGSDADPDVDAHWHELDDDGCSVNHGEYGTDDDRSYSPTGQRIDSAPAGWPFGALTELQLQRHLDQAAQLRRLNEQHRAQRAAAAREAILARAPEALL
jgi:hypothetical protein